MAKTTLMPDLVISFVTQVKENEVNNLIIDY